MEEPNNRMRNILLAVAVVVGLAVAMVPLALSVFSDDSGQSGTNDPAASDVADPLSTGEQIPDATTPPDPAGTSYELQDSQRIDCPTPAPGAEVSSDAELAELTLPCLTDGGSSGESSVAELAAGRPTLINVWAWWCGPCRQELPVLQEVAESHPEWNIVGVHVNERGQAGVDLLEDLGVRFASFQDSDGELESTADLPSVVPLSLVYGPDGSRSELHPGELTSVSEVEEIMTRTMGEP